jgi:hypothetical protein
MFKFPVGVQLFNRPQYAERVLNSLSLQTYSVKQKEMCIFIDGFRGSIYESRGEVDCTSTVEEIARSIFPLAEVKKFDENRGIAELHNLLQKEVFSQAGVWAAFFEEDIVLDPTYLEELSELIEIVNSHDRVVRVACFQVLNSLAHLPRGYHGFYPGTGTKAFAERKTFFDEKQPIVSKYIDLVKDQLHSVEQFVNSYKGAQLGAEGYLLSYLQKDSLVESFLHFNKKLHVVTRPGLATDIGIHGIHDFTTPELKVNPQMRNYSGDIEQRKMELEKSVSQVTSEATRHIVANFQEILDGFYTSRSRKKMIRKVILTTIKRLKR